MGHRNVTKIPTVMLIRHPSPISRTRTRCSLFTRDVNMFIPVLVCFRGPTLPRCLFRQTLGLKNMGLINSIGYHLCICCGVRGIKHVVLEESDDVCVCVWKRSLQPVVD